MNCEKIGKLIYQLRKEQQLTQQQIAQQLNVSDKTISKWERGLGCPDVSLLGELAQILQIPIESLLSGTLTESSVQGVQMKNIKFYVCPCCHHLTMSTGESSVSCCGKTLYATAPQKADPQEQLQVEMVENEYYITSAHEMSKEHYIAFVGVITGDTLLIRKQYPQWDLQTRLPQLSRGKLVWYCTSHGLFYQIL